MYIWLAALASFRVHRMWMLLRRSGACTLGYGVLHVHGVCKGTLGNSNVKWTSQDMQQGPLYRVMMVLRYQGFKLAMIVAWADPDLISWRMIIPLHMHEYSVMCMSIDRQTLQHGKCDASDIHVAPGFSMVGLCRQRAASGWLQGPSCSKCLFQP